MPSEIRPRLDSDVVRLVEKNADVNGRTPPAEVNFALRRYYEWEAAKLKTDKRAFGTVCGKKK